MSRQNVRGRRLRAAPSFALFLLLASPPSADAQTTPSVVTGTVSGSDGRRVPTAQVVVMAAGRSVGTDLTDGAGRFHIQVPAGDVTITVPAQFGLRPAEGPSLRVEPGDTVEVELIVERQVHVMDGLVVSARGLPGGQAQSASIGFVGVVDRREIERRVTADPTDALRLEPGVDMADTGLNSRIITFRSFNNIFTGSVRYLSDFRPANLPSLRANFVHFSPTATPDVERMEIILGPSSAIYGPNSASGVLNVITRSPLADLPESSFAVSGGNQSVFQSEVRTSMRLGRRVGFKASARWFQGEEYFFLDPAEAAARELIDTDPDAYAAYLSDLGVPEDEIPLRMSRVGIRDLDIRRWGADGRLDWAPTEGDTLIFQGGITSASGIENTPLGAAQASDWLYQYVQARYHAGNLFAQAFLNGSDAGDTYLLRDGAPLFDRSRVYGVQLRHGFELFDGVEEVTYGADWTRTDPRTGGTIHGQFEDEDEITEWGGYIQSRTRVVDGFHVLGTLRLDQSNVIDDPVLSPRVGVVWEPSERHTFSASWSEGFSTPTPTNYFLDLSGGTAAPPLGMLGYRTRARGTGPDGIRFSNDAGGYQGMRSPCTPAEAGGPSALIPASSGAVWQCVVGVLQAQGAIDAPTAAYLASLDPEGSVSLNALDPVTLSLVPLEPGAVEDVAPLRENTTTTFEVGYRGLIGERVFLQTALWHTTRQQLSSPLTLVTPLLTLNGEELAVFLAGQGLPVEQAQAIAAGAASVPGGVLSSSDIQGQGPELVATYRNFGEIRYWGIDLGAQAELTPNLTLRATGSWVSDDNFQVGDRRVPLNAPALKGSLGLIVDRLSVPVSGEVGVRYQSEFPVESGEYVGKACLGADFAATADCVPDAVLVDAAVGWERIGGSDASLRLAIRNLFDTDFQPFLGVPQQGRQISLRLEYLLR